MQMPINSVLAQVGGKTSNSTRIPTSIQQSIQASLQPSKSPIEGETETDSSDFSSLLTDQVDLSSEGFDQSKRIQTQTKDADAEQFALSGLVQSQLSPPPQHQQPIGQFERFEKSLTARQESDRPSFSVPPSTPSSIGQLRSLAGQPMRTSKAQLPTLQTAEWDPSLGGTPLALAHLAQKEQLPPMTQAQVHQPATLHSIIQPGTHSRVQGYEAAAPGEGDVALSDFLTAYQPGELKGKGGPSSVPKGDEFLNPVRSEHRLPLFPQGAQATIDQAASPLLALAGIPNAKNQKEHLTKESGVPDSLAPLLSQSAQGGRPLMPFDQTGAQPPVDVTGHVTQNGMIENRLTREALINLNSQIQSLSARNGGGEIRIRLKPENLGEIHLKVSTQGNDVGLMVKTSDESAKRILEASLHDLKEGLQNHNLHLSAVEFSVGRAAPGFASGMDLPQQPHQANLNLHHEASQGFSSRSNWEAQTPESSARTLSRATAPAGLRAAQGWARPAAAMGSSGRLDVLA